MVFMSNALCSGNDPSTVAAAPRWWMSPEPPAPPPLGETDLGREISSGLIFGASAAFPGRGRRRPPGPATAECPFCDGDAAELTASGPAGTGPTAKLPGRVGYDENRGSAAGTSSRRPARNRSAARAPLNRRRGRKRGVRKTLPGHGQKRTAAASAGFPWTLRRVQHDHESRPAAP
jgi:hypothetical protein